MEEHTPVLPRGRQSRPTGLSPININKRPNTSSFQSRSASRGSINNPSPREGKTPTPPITPTPSITPSLTPPAMSTKTTRKPSPSRQRFDPSQGTYPQLEKKGTYTSKPGSRSTSRPPSPSRSPSPSPSPSRTPSPPPSPVSPLFYPSSPTNGRSYTLNSDTESTLFSSDQETLFFSSPSSSIPSTPPDPYSAYPSKSQSSHPKEGVPRSHTPNFVKEEVFNLDELDKSLKKVQLTGARRAPHEKIRYNTIEPLSTTNDPSLFKTISTSQLAELYARSKKDSPSSGFTGTGTQNGKKKNGSHHLGDNVG